MTEQKEHYILDQELTTGIGLRCIDCGSPNTVYAITYPYGQLIPAGAYCYNCLLKRCIAARRIPYPIPETLLDKLKFDINMHFSGLHKYH